MPFIDEKYPKQSAGRNFMVKNHHASCESFFLNLRTIKTNFGNILQLKLR